MDDLVGGLFLLFVGALVVGLLVVVALAMVGFSVVVGSVVVGVGGAWEFVVSFGRRVRGRGGGDRRVLAPEPAFELYVLGQLGRDVRSAGRDAWGVMQRLRGLTGKFAADHGEGVTMPLGIGALVGGYVGVGLGVVVGGLLTLPVLIVAVVVMAGAWVLIGVLRGAEGLRRRVRRTSYECPVDHERFPLPVYVCPGCGAEHRRLVPGRWGIVKRECECGRVALPTMVLNGRQRVPQRCPSGHPMAGIIGFAEILRVALVAGPSAGKSTFLAGALHELDRLSKAGTLALAVVDGSRSDFDAALDDLAHGRLPAKTQVGGNPALVAEVQGGGRSRVLSLYDVAGESYAGDDEIRELRFLEVPSGLVLLVDPLALERFAADRREEIAAAEDSLRPSPVQPIRVLERMLGALDAAGARGDKLPLAVVVAKADALGVGEEIAALEDSEGDRAVPVWLERQGAGNFVRAVEADFANVGWFCASALGRTPDPADRAAFVPAGTAAPVLWLLGENGVIPAAESFSPAKAAERLSGAVAGDFPPIGPRGWAWRAIPAALVSLAVLAGLAIGTATAIRAIQDSSQPAYASDNPDTTTTDDTTYNDPTDGNLLDNDTPPDDPAATDYGDGGGAGAIDPGVPAGRYVRLGSFRSAEGADREQARLQSEGIDALVVDSNTSTGLLPAFHVIVAGPTTGPGEERRITRAAKRAGITGPLTGDLGPISSAPPPESLEGSFSGLVKQVDSDVARRNGDLLVEVDFDYGGESGSVRYERPYCQAALTLDGTTGGALTYVEDDIDGSCLGGGTWSVKPEDSDLLVTWWRSEGVTFRVGRLTPLP